MQKTEKTAEEEAHDDNDSNERINFMKRITSFFLTLVLLTGLIFSPAFPASAAEVPWPENVEISAEGGILMDAGSGAVLYGKNIHQAYYPASITKILTALVVIENCNLDETVTFSHNAVYNVEAGSSSAGMDEGDQMSVRDCLYAMLLKSANEAANALAEHAGGSIEAFAEMMNQKAQSLGCTDSHFNNPSGLNDPEHYTSAHDMALIACAAFENPTFVEIDSSRYYDLPPSKRNPEGSHIYPGHKMLKKNLPEYYPGILGGKTGYTSLAGNTLVTCAERNGMRLVSVVLNGHQTHYSDTKTLLDFGFANFYSVNVSAEDTTYSSLANDMTIAGLPAADLSILHLQDNSRITLPNSASFSDTTSSISYDLPVSAPKLAVAQITYQYGGHDAGYAWLLRDSKTPASETDADAKANPNANAKNAEADPAVSAQSEMSSTETNSPESAASATTGSAGSASLDSETGTSDSPLHLHIPLGFWIALAVIGTALLILAIVMFAKFHIEKREENERAERYQRRQQRIQDLGMSPTEFDLLMEEKRSGSALRSKENRRRSRRRKTLLQFFKRN